MGIGNPFKSVEDIGKKIVSGVEQTGQAIKKGTKDAAVSTKNPLNWKGRDWIGAAVNPYMDIYAAAQAHDRSSFRTFGRGALGVASQATAGLALDPTLVAAGQVGTVGAAEYGGSKSAQAGENAAASEKQQADAAVANEQFLASRDMLAKKFLEQRKTQKGAAAKLASFSSLTSAGSSLGGAGNFSTILGG